MGRILVTGASTWLGGQVVAALARRSGGEVFAVDEVAPRHQLGAPFILLGSDRAALADHVLALQPDTVVHLLTAAVGTVANGGEAADQAVVGNQALFGAAGRAATVRRVVVRSDTAVYPLGPRSPSVLTEGDADPSPTNGFARSVVDTEAAAAALAARRGDITVAVLRLAPVFGPTVDDPLSRYLQMPVVPTLLGFDPRLHLLHQDDAVSAVLAAVDGTAAGTCNVASDGPMYLSRLLRLGRRVAQPLPRPALAVARNALGRGGLRLPGHLALVLEHGMVLDTGAMRRRLGFTPAFSVRHAALAMRPGADQP
ncbi:MAG: NAD-dependent epimerase/dehydratase family protein [Acidimicrobiia bacterium]|nr:NAD-dependent epimerase/dehydratase family protein [Acidimicrobiia bacterium]